MWHGNSLRAGAAGSMAAGVQPRAVAGPLFPQYPPGPGGAPHPQRGKAASGGPSGAQQGWHRPLTWARGAVPSTEPVVVLTRISRWQVATLPIPAGAQDCLQAGARG